MDWLANLGKDKHRIIYVHKQKNGKERAYTKNSLNIREYKQQYYINNIDKYIERNRKASRERSLKLLEDRASESELCKNIENLSTPDIIYKMKYILNNQD